MNILKTGAFLPSKIVKNSYFQNYLDTTDEWIYTRTGIKERRVSENSLAEMAIESMKHLTQEELDSIECILCSTSSPESFFPSTAVLIAQHYKLTCPAFDFQAACTGFLYGLSLAEGLLAHQYKRVLLIATEKAYSFSRPEDRNTVILFGDGAGFFLLERSSKLSQGILASDGTKSHLLSLTKNSYISMDGKEVFKEAIKGMYSLITLLIQQMNISLKDIDYFVFHQANKRILQSLAEKFEIEESKILMNIEYYANTASASIPILFHESTPNPIQRGNKILMAAFGGGLTSGARIFVY